MGENPDRNRQAADDIVIRRMGIACWIRMAAVAFVILQRFPTAITVSARSSILLLMYTVCLVSFVRINSEMSAFRFELHTNSVLLYKFVLSFSRRLIFTMWPPELRHHAFCKQFLKFRKNTPVAILKECENIRWLQHHNSP